MTKYVTLTLFLTKRLYVNNQMKPNVLRRHINRCCSESRIRLKTVVSQTKRLPCYVIHFLSKFFFYFLESVEFHDNSQIENQICQFSMSLATLTLRVPGKTCDGDGTTAMDHLFLKLLYLSTIQGVLVTMVILSGSKQKSFHF